MSSTDTPSVTRPLPGVTRVALALAARFEILAGSEDSAIEISGSPHLVAGTVVALDGDRVGVSFRHAQQQSQGDGLLVRIRLGALTDVDLSGAGTVRISGVSGAQLTLNLSGIGNVEIAGTTEVLRLNVSGLGKVDTTALAASKVIVRSSGTASVDVRASEALEADVSGIGSVRYAGSPQRIERRVSGLGRVSPL